MPRSSNKTVKPLIVPSSQPSAKIPIVNPLSSVGTTSSFGQIVKEGMAFGVGNAVAHNIIGRLFGSSSSTVVPAAPVKVHAYEHCMELTKNNKEVCEHLI
jgi:hypothetical protein